MTFIVKIVFIPLKMQFNSQEGFNAKVNTEDNTVTILSKQQHPIDELINTLSNVGYISKAI